MNAYNFVQASRHLCSKAPAPHASSKSPSQSELKILNFSRLLHKCDILLLFINFTIYVLLSIAVDSLTCQSSVTRVMITLREILYMVARGSNTFCQRRIQVIRIRPPSLRPPDSLHDLTVTLWSRWLFPVNTTQSF